MGRYRQIGACASLRFFWWLSPTALYINCLSHDSLTAKANGQYTLFILLDLSADFAALQQPLKIVNLSTPRLCLFLLHLPCRIVGAHNSLPPLPQKFPKALCSNTTYSLLHLFPWSVDWLPWLPVLSIFWCHANLPLVLGSSFSPTMLSKTPKLSWCFLPLLIYLLYWDQLLVPPFVPGASCIPGLWPLLLAHIQSLSKSCSLRLCNLSKICTF